MPINISVKSRKLYGKASMSGRASGSRKMFFRPEEISEREFTENNKKANN